MVEINNIEKEIASNLLKINAIKLQPNDPFTWSSGWKSPIYCDNRSTLSYPDIRNLIKKGFCDKIMEIFKDVEVIAGVATAGISHGALIADELNLPFTYVRPEPKKHGAGRQIEGKVPTGKKVVVIEDLISTGGSSIKAIDALRREGAEVLGLAAIFTYSFDHADQNLKDAKVPYLTLSDYNVMLDEAIKTGYIKAEEKSLLEEWRKDPSNWIK